MIEIEETSKCSYCDIDSNECEYFVDSLTNEWYQDVTTYEWDSYIDGYVHQRIYGPQYCQYCGRKLFTENS